MLNQRRCCNCGGNGPFARVATCQDSCGDILGYLCVCVSCATVLSEGAIRERMLEHLVERLPSPVRATATMPDH